MKGAASGGVWSTCELSLEMSEKEPEDPEPRGIGREDASLGESISVCWRGRVPRASGAPGAPRGVKLCSVPGVKAMSST